MSIDWNAVEQETGKKYKDWAPEGKHTVKLADVEVRQVGNKGAYVADLKFEETDVFKFPKASYWLSKDKANWRIHSMKELLTVLGGNEANAKKVCEMAESKDDFEYAVKGYEKALKTLAAKHVETEIEVYFGGRYSSKGTPMNDATLADPRVYNRRKKQEDPMAGAEAITLDGTDDFSDMPF